MLFKAAHANTTLSVNRATLFCHFSELFFLKQDQFLTCLRAIFIVEGTHSMQKKVLHETIFSKIFCKVTRSVHFERLQIYVLL